MSNSNCASWCNMSCATMQHLALASILTALGISYYQWRRMNQKLRLGAMIWSRQWFTERSVMWPGQAFSLEMKKLLYSGRSKYQQIDVFEGVAGWGRVLALDGCIQVSERDECAYQELMAHIPAVAHPCPKKALVIGGGDGGVLRELAKHKDITELHICELDEEVIRVSKEFLPFTACGYDDPRVTVHIEDGFAFMKKFKNEFDIIIIDSSDPVGPAEVLFQEPCYRAAFEALTADGILVTQGECMWIHMDVIKGIKDFASKFFDDVDYAWMTIPTYPCGTIGMICCSKGKSRARKPIRANVIKNLPTLKYYTEKIHESAFVLPKFAEDAL